MTTLPKLLVLIVEQQALLDFIQIICLIYIIRVEQLMFRDQCMKSMAGPHLLSRVRRGKEERSKAEGGLDTQYANTPDLQWCGVYTVYTPCSRR